MGFLDEVVLRRTWKLYKNEFNKIEVSKLHDEYEKAKQVFDAEQAQKDLLTTEPTSDDQYSVRKIRLKIEESELKLDSAEYHQAEEKIKHLKVILFDAKQAFGFAKADQDEVFYEWKNALEENKIEHAEHFKKKYYDLEAKLAEYKIKRDKAEKDVADVQAILDGFSNDVKKWKNLEKKSLEPLAKIFKKIEAAESRGDEIAQVVINDLGKGGNVEWGTVDRCESCHVAINRDGFEDQKNPYKTHPNRQEIFALHPVEKFGCTSCHGGQGRGTQIKGKPFEEGDFAHGYVKHWKDPVMKDSMMEANCSKCHLDQWKLAYAPTYMKGKQLFWNNGCTGCHNIRGFEEAPKVAPSLRKIADKVNQEWLVEWVKNPKAYLPHTRMPKPPLDIDEPAQTEKVAAYILQSSEKYDFLMENTPVVILRTVRKYLKL
ncbi:MAG: c-type cytochrome [Deltaproteobacteria bacterium]|nr:MAG: c-type cytochrome [Deltaproteobacteria bacterium]